MFMVIMRNWIDRLEDKVGKERRVAKKQKTVEEKKWRTNIWKRETSKRKQGNIYMEGSSIG